MGKKTLASHPSFPRVADRFMPLLLAITLLGGALRLYGVWNQPLFPDEISAAVSAGHYMEGGQFGPTMWYHPNLRNILLYWTARPFGYTPLALRGISLASGVFSIPVLGLLILALTRNEAASLLAAFLLAVEQVHITFSRQAIQETWTPFFFLLGTLWVVWSIRKDRPWLMVLAGVGFGLGITSKFHAFFPLLVCLGAALLHVWRERSKTRVVFVVCSLVLVPAIVFLLSYLPWFARGYGIGDWLAMQKALLTHMATHTGNPMDQVIDTQAWQWFLRPMGYANFAVSLGVPHVTIAFSNPVVWLLVLPALVYLIRVRWRDLFNAWKNGGEEAEGLLWCLALFLVCYFPLMFSPRPIWLLSALAVIPFAHALVALFLVRWLENFSWRRRGLAVYLFLVLTTSLALYPMAVGQGKHHAYLSGIVERFRPPFEGQGGVSP